MEQRKCWLKSLELKFDEAARKFYLTAIYRYYDAKGYLRERTYPKIMLPINLSHMPDVRIVEPGMMLNPTSNRIVEFPTGFLIATYGKNVFELLPGEMNGLTGAVLESVIAKRSN